MRRAGSRGKITLATCVSPSPMPTGSMVTLRLPKALTRRAWLTFFESGPVQPMTPGAVRGAASAGDGRSMTGSRKPVRIAIGRTGGMTKGL